MSSGGLQGGGEGDRAGGTQEAGPWLPGIRSWRKCTGNTLSFPTTKLHREPRPHFPSIAEDSVWRGRSSSLDREAGVRSGLTASLRTEGTHSTPPTEGLELFTSPPWDMDHCCSRSEPLPGNRVRRKETKGVWTPPPQGPQLFERHSKAGGNRNA